jgi:glyoxylase-like metal-dependent hydrolase (beta-lactamase superfamily II)
MQEIGKNIYLEESYSGVALGAVKLEHGLLLVDSPLRFSDQGSWRKKAAQLGEGGSQVTLMLDTHIDRTIGLRALGGCVLGHDKAAEILANRPANLRPQDFCAGAEAEALDLPTNVRWAQPAMTFSNTMAFYTDKSCVRITHQPGAHQAGCWVRLDAEKIIFVGDSVVAHQPPFLAEASLQPWLDELAELSSDPLQDYRIVSSRNGLIRQKAIEKLSDFLSYIKEILPDLASQDDRDEAIADLLPGLLRKLSFDKKNAELYQKRLAYGLTKYLKCHENLFS